MNNFKRGDIVKFIDAPTGSADIEISAYSVGAGETIKLDSNTTMIVTDPNPESNALFVRVFCNKKCIHALVVKKWLRHIE